MSSKSIKGVKIVFSLEFNQIFTVIIFLNVAIYKDSNKKENIIFTSNKGIYSSQNSSLDQNIVRKHKKGQKFSSILSPHMIGLRSKNSRKKFKTHLYYPRRLYYSLNKKAYIHSDANGGFGIMR
jgi:hypothetical protein